MKMMSTTSIKFHLLLSLLGILLACSLMIFFVNRYLAVVEVDELYDAQLAQTSRIMQGFVDRPIDEIDFDNLNTAFLKAVVAYSGDMDDERRETGHGYEGKLAIQIWDSEGNLLVKTPTAPMYALSPLKNGYFLKKYLDFNWYVFAHRATQNGLWIILAEREDVRNELTHKISMSYVAGFILITFFLAGSLWFAVNRGLRPLVHISSQISERHIDRLEAVGVDNRLSSSRLPDELKPLVGAINALMGRVAHDLERERRFLGDVAHELRTPLAGLKLHAQIAFAADNLMTCKQSIHKVILGIDRSTRLVTQLLTLARLDARALGEKEMITIGQFCKDLIDNNDNPITGSPFDHHHHIILSPSLMQLQLPAYPVLLSVMLRNLLENACRYSPANTFIHIDGGTLTTEQIFLSIVDEGEGVPAERLASLGNRFFRENKADRQGSGLGLSIVKRIAELHDGQVEFHNHSPHGLEVNIVFTLPSHSSVTDTSNASFPMEKYPATRGWPNE